jgi:hypothetical protein
MATHFFVARDVGCSISVGFACFLRPTAFASSLLLELPLLAILKGTI